MRLRGQGLFCLPAMRRFYALCLAALALLVAPRAHAQTCTTSWTNAAGGAWESDSNWSSGVPETGDVACLTLGGTYTVTTTAASRAFAHLVLGGASGTQTLESAGRFTLDNATVRPNGRWVLGYTYNGGLFATGTVAVEGVLESSASSFLASAGTLDIAPSGTFRLTGGAEPGGTTTPFRIRGTFEGVDCPAFNGCYVRSPISVDGGTLRITSTTGTGQLQFSADATLHNATVDVPAGTVLNLGGTTYTLTGTMSGTPAGTVYFNNITAAAGAGGATLAVGGTGIQLVGSSQFSSAGGAFTNSGLIVLPPASGGNGARLLGVEMRNTGRLRVETSTIEFLNGSTVRNEVGGVVEILNSATFGGGLSTNTNGRFVNAGTVVNLGPVASSQGNIRVPYDGLPGSVLRAEIGQLYTSAGGSLHDVTFEAAEGAVIAVGGANTDTVRVRGTMSGAPVGALTFYTARFAAESGDVTLNLGGTGLDLSGAVALVNGDGAFVNTGLLKAYASSGNFVALDGSLLINRSRIDLQLGLGFRNNATLRNDVTGELELGTYGALSGVGGSVGRFENYGRVVKTGTGTSSFDPIVTQAYPGSHYVSLGGRLDLPNPSTLSFPAGVTLSGTNEVYWPGDFEATGTISPGTDDQPISPLHLWQYRPSLTEGDPRLVIDVGPNDTSDLLDMRAGASIRLGGTLVVRVQPGYVPRPGDLFTILQRTINASAITGSFSNVVVEGAPVGITFRPEVDGITSVRLRAVVDVGMEALAGTTAEDGAPVTVVVRAAAAAASLTALDVPLVFEGTARRFDDYTADITGTVLRIPAGATEARLTLFPRRDALTDEGDETIVVRIGEGGDVPAGDSVVVTLQDGPSSNALAADGIAPSRGGDSGRLTATIYGRGLDASAAVSLVGAGRTLAGTDVVAGIGGLGLTATFDLNGAPQGVYDLVVTQGDQTSTLAGAFTVEENRGVSVWADVVGTSNPRVGRWSTYTVMLGNSGNADVHDVMLFLRLTNGLQYEFMEGIAFPGGLPESERRLTLDSVTQAQVMPFWIERLPAGATVAYRLRVLPGPPAFRGGEGMGLSLIHI